jgi:hypothetical protein
MKSLLVGTGWLPLLVVLVVTSGLGSCFDLMVWFGWEWDDFGLACVEPFDL